MLGPPDEDPPDDDPDDEPPDEEDEEEDEPLFHPPVAVPVHVAPKASHARGQLSAAGAQWLLLQVRPLTGLPSEQSQNQLGQSSAFWHEGPCGSVGLLVELEPEAPDDEPDDPDDPDELPSPPEPVLLPPEQATRPTASESAMNAALTKRMRSSP